MRWGWAAHADRQAMVVGGTKDDLPGHAEYLADLAGGQPCVQVHLRQDVWLDSDPVFPVEPSPGSQLDPLSAQPVLDGPGRDLGQFRDLAAREPLPQVQAGKDFVGHGCSRAARGPAAPGAPRLDRHSRPVKYARDHLPAQADNASDAVGGQSLAAVQVADPLRHGGPWHISRAARARAVALRRQIGRITSLVRAAARETSLGHAVGLPLSSRDRWRYLRDVDGEPLRR
jgi:hypothetical protein